MSILVNVWQIVPSAITSCVAVTKYTLFASYSDSSVYYSLLERAKYLIYKYSSIIRKNGEEYIWGKGSEDGDGRSRE